MDPAKLASYVTLGTSAVSSGTGLIGGILANRANAKENQKNREWNEKMWHMTNEYNLPINVYQREMEGLKANGLNPNLAYGDLGNSIASYAGNLGTQKAYDNPAKDFKLDAVDAFRLKNETDVAESTVDVNETQAQKNASEARKADTEADLLDMEKGYKPKMLQLAFEKAGLDVSNNEVENTILLATQNAQVAKFLTDLELSAISKEISSQELLIKAQELIKAVHDAENAKEQVELTKAETNLTKAKAQTEKTLQAANKAQAAYYKAMRSEIPSRIEKNRAETKQALALALKYSSDVDLNEAQIYKITNEVEEALYNGNVDRVKKICEMWGTGVSGAIERGLNKGYEKIMYGTTYEENAGATIRKPTPFQRPSRRHK